MRPLPEEPHPQHNTWKRSLTNKRKKRWALGEGCCAVQTCPSCAQLAASSAAPTQTAGRTACAPVSTPDSGEGSHPGVLCCPQGTGSQGGQQEAHILASPYPANVKDWSPKPIVSWYTFEPLRQCTKMAAPCVRYHVLQSLVSDPFLLCFTMKTHQFSQRSN